jgi:1-acyl-sn-glycerol-3-phosphate acyltransferase
VLAPLVRFGFRVNVTGVEHVPTDGPAILSANHRSFFDTPLIMTTAPRRVLFLGKAEYMDDWKTRAIFPALGMVPIRRDKGRSSMAALTTAAELLDAGELVGIYPEGTRSRDGLLHKGHTGVAHLALMTGAPIVPIGLRGTERIQPIGSAIARPFVGKVSVEFGEPVYPKDYRSGGRRKQRQHMVRDVMAAIASMTDQEPSDEYASDEPPLIRAGSESVYRVTVHVASGLSWRHAAERAVDDAANRYDDARVGEVREMYCRVLPDGDVRFATELALSTKFSRRPPSDLDEPSSTTTPGGTT